jgi:tetratricopeptide (TPR) repeat protein
MRHSTTFTSAVTHRSPATDCRSHKQCLLRILSYMRHLLSGLLVITCLSAAEPTNTYSRQAETPSEYVRRITESSPPAPDASVPYSGAQGDSRSYVVRPARRAEVVRANELAVPAKARKAFERAQRELRRSEPDYTLAVQQLESAVQVAPRFSKAWDWLGQLRLRSGELSRAIDAFEIAIQTDSDNISPYLRLAAIALRQRRMEDAIRLADRALKLDPATIEGHYYRAAACHALDRTQCALASATAVVAHGGDSRYARVHLITGDVLAARGEFDAAAREYSRVVELEPGSRAAAAAAAWIANRNR